MITWMQRHKKWLLITMWISCFSFVAAGFVGWGAYKFNSGEKVVKYKDIKISQKNINNRIRNRVIFELKMIGNSNPTKADYQKYFKENNKRLNKISIEEEYEKTKILNFAKKDLKITILDKELLDYIISIPQFLKKGVFKKDLYKNFLIQNRLSPVKFEEKIKEELLLDKMNKLIKPNIKYDKDLPMIETQIQKEIQLNVFKFDSEEKNIKYKESDIIKYYEQTKNLYKTEENIDISYEKIPKKNKKVLLNKYLKMKKNKIPKKLSKNDNLTTKDELFKKIKKESINFKKKLIKPFLYKEEYYLVNINKYTNSHIKKYKDIKKQIIKMYLKEESIKKVKKLADNYVFKNIDKIGYVSFKNDNPLLKGSINDKSEEYRVIKDILYSNKIKDKIVLNNKIIVFKTINLKYESIPLLEKVLEKQFIENIKNIKYKIFLKKYIGIK